MELLFENDKFIFSGALMVAPFTFLSSEEKPKRQTFQFPHGKWISMRNYSEIQEGPGEVVLYNNNSGNIFLRQGCLIPF